jgi:hypothetical protein
MPNIARFYADLWSVDTFNLFDDFFAYTTAQLWTTDSGTITLPDVEGGRLTMLSGAVANNYSGIYQTAQTFKLIAGRPIYARAKLQYTEPAINTANVFFGWCSTPAGGGVIVNGGTGFRASGVVIGIGKLQGSLAWRGHAGNGTSPLDNVSNGLGPMLAGKAADQVLEINGIDQDGANFSITYQIDGEYLRDVNNAIIRHMIPIAGAVPMALCAYIKAGDANAQTLVLDSMAGAQRKEPFASGVVA